MFKNDWQHFYSFDVCFKLISLNFIDYKFSIRLVYSNIHYCKTYRVSSVWRLLNNLHHLPIAIHNPVRLEPTNTTNTRILLSRNAFPFFFLLRPRISHRHYGLYRWRNIYTFLRQPTHGAYSMVGTSRFVCTVVLKSTVCCLRYVRLVGMSFLFRKWYAISGRVGCTPAALPYTHTHTPEAKLGSIQRTIRERLEKKNLCIVTPQFPVYK